MSLSDYFSPSQKVLLRPWYRAFNSIKYGITLPYYRFLDRYRLSDINKIYTDEYFEKRAKPPYDEATKVAVDVLDEHFEPDTVFDVGCAIGVYLKYFSEKGATVAGIEGAERAVKKGLVDSIEKRDLRDPPPQINNRSFDLVLCIEVAEHLHTIYAEGLVKTILSATHDDSIIVFTAAPPGQYGTNHINLQYPQYWIKLFSENGWEYQTKRSLTVSADIQDRSGEPLIMTDNLMVFTKPT